MSTILKALQRLEREKDDPISERPLREAVATAKREPVPARRRRWLPPLLAGVLGIAVGALVLLLWPAAEDAPDGGPSAPQVAATPPSAPPAAVPAARATPRPRATPAPDAPRARPARPPARARQPGPPDEAFASGVEVVARPAPTPRIDDTPGVSPVPVERPGSRRPVEGSRLPDAAPMGRGVVGLPPPATTPPRVAGVPAPAPTAPPAAPPAPSPLDSIPAPPLPEGPTPSSTAPADVPAPESVLAPSTLAGFQVERTQWHPTPSRRSAVVAMTGRDAPQRVSEGDEVGGYVVKEIQPTGVVFALDGVEVQRRIGE